MQTLTPPDMPSELGRRPSGLVPAFVVAFALHALVLVGVMSYRLTPPAPPGEQQISIDLSPVMTDAPTQAPAEQQMSEDAPPEAKPSEEPADEPVKPPPPAETAEARPTETQALAPQTQAVIEPDSQVVTSTAEQAEPLAPPPPEVAQVPEARVPEARVPEARVPAARVPAEKPVAPEKPKPDLARLKAEREARLKKIRDEKRREEQREEAREERLEAIREAKARAAREARAKQAKARDGASERDSAAAARQSSAGRAAAGNDPSALARWKGALSSAIHSRMNTNAAVGTSGGTAVVNFIVLRSGQVASASLSRSSGFGQIDSAALAAVRGSLPAAPPGINASSLSVAVPLNFRSR